MASTTTSQGVQRVVNSNPACCSIPPVQSNYVPKGTYTSFAGFDSTYVTGPPTSSIAIVNVFDIFGFWPQTQQGADILAQTLNARVVMPDFFAPDKPFFKEKFPPQSQDDKNDLQAFFAGPAKPDKAVEGLVRVGEELRAQGAEKVGAYGLCWGGKVAILTGSKENTPFDAVATFHPAMLSADDADNLRVPLGLFISNDEPKAEYDKMIEKLKQKPYADKIAYKHYANMFHGWAAARANLEDEENRKEFEDAYTNLTAFFKKAFERDRGGTETRV
ncbi:uncharacterized protein FOMMEDRAFT_19489 [Fomitiporia mediterranea MF3/22]|uniref:uncharacterized protein n=1 Tax=Fomitiporia mediterranea (strain MF3/22) TaxID=694068 RepID=UPI0004409609|nr:uncharacterized protein FOMMEDRAFT_19489 [Fomitiporia mediterranea MF3/22]EJD04229.1 hypothetical protein FOMMEDRAFT_19489 [Fomitiporia mediterranea MF3/22]